ncbi:MAG TPA: hypothetical protein VH251_01770 [Verrucomicrobiae bacterium]|jgi:hypothetical protein|nr:hypothetical protein [Verrucomicrobiae bacterium]
MSIDKHTLQKWIAGAELRLTKTHRPFAGVPLVGRIKKLAARTQQYVVTEKIDLTRARDFRAQETSEDLLFASVQLPVIGERGIGNDVGMAVASFNYTDEEGDEHSIIAVCAYVISGVVRKERKLKHVMVIPMV